MPTDEEKAAQEQARRDAKAEAEWEQAKKDIARHDRDFERKHGPSDGRERGDQQ